MQKIEELKQQVLKEPNDHRLYYRLGKAYIESDELVGATKALSRAAQLAPERIAYHLLLAKTCIKQRQFVPAKKEYKKVLSLDPANLKAHMNLGLVFEFYLRDPSRALAHYRKYTQLGGDDPRVMKRFKLLSEEVQAKDAHDRTEAEAAAGTAKRSKADEREDRLRELYWWRDKLKTRIQGKEKILMRAFCVLTIVAVLVQCFDAFPVFPSLLATILCLVTAGLAALRPKAGIAVALVVMFFPIAFYNPLMGYLYVATVVILLRLYWAENPGKLMIILLVPILVNANVAYAIPLGAALLLGARPARALGFTAAIVGLGCLLAENIHQMGPLSINHTGVPFPLRPAEAVSVVAFLVPRWFGSLFSSELIDSLMNFTSSVFPALLMPPTAIIQVAAWGLAGYMAARLSGRRRPRDLARALGAAAAILVLQAVIIENMPYSNYFSSWAAIKGLFLSLILISPIAFYTAHFYEAEVGAEEEDIGWNSIGGLDTVKKEIQMATQYQFKSGYSRFNRRFGLRGGRGILFYGPPGCGKTMFAKVLAKESGVSFFSIKSSDFRSKWYGETEQNLSAIFEKGRDNAPSIIFFDEIDAILDTREGGTMGDSPGKGILTLFLTEMDGVGSKGGVLVVGATNEPDSIDPAALRPGRFDKLIYIPLPDEKGRETIFRIHLRKKPLAGALDFQKLAKTTERLSGADIADVCSKVAEQSMRESLEKGHTTKIAMDALEAQIKATKPSVSLESLRKYEELKEKYDRRTLKDDTAPAEEKEKYSWKQIGGLDHLKQELIEAIETPLKKPQLYEKYKINPPKGVLFYGPPGCGKTLMAKIVASECGAHFLSVDSKKESGESIRKWFIRARENKPSILFFDEIDSIAASRDLGGISGQGIVPQLLVEMDGMEDLKQVVIIAATNRPDQLDGALMRPGRFDRLIYIPPPDEKSRRKIVRIHLKGKPLARGIDLAAISRETEGYSGADLAALCYEASMSLIRKSDSGHQKITMDDITAAMGKIKSSISAEELEYFEEMKAKYSRG